MFKKYRIIPLFICISLILSMITPVHAESLVNISEKKMGLLFASGIASKQVYAEEELTANVTRAEFIRYAAKLTGITDDGMGDEYYIDISSYREKQLINQFVKLGYLSVNETRRFEPDRIITDTEAIKVVIHMIGYGQLAQEMGGFPSGYMELAQRLDIWKKDYSEKLNVSEMFYLFANALETVPFEPAGFKSDGTIIYNNQGNGKSILSTYHDIYLTEGLLRAVDEYSVDGTVAPENAVMIGETSCKFSDDMRYSAERLLGHWVSAYYKENGDGDRTLLFICDNKTQYAEIELKDIQKLDESYNLVCVSGTKYKNYKLDRKVTVLYNGEPETENHRELFQSFDLTSNGTAKLIDSNNDGQYDYCIIMHYVDAYIDGVNNTQGLIYNVRDNFRIDLTDYKYVMLYNAEGDHISVSDLRDGMVLSYASGKSKKFFWGQVASELITGTITAIKKEDGYTFYTVNGTKYVVLDEALKDINVGVDVLATFSINCFGQITHIELGDASTYKYALLLGTEKEWRTLRLKYYREDGKMMVSELADKVVVDGKSYKDPEKALLAIPNSTESRIYPQMVRICVDENERINQIDTVYCSENENEEISLIETPVTGSGYVNYIDGNYQLIGDSTLIIKKTPVFCVPALENLINGNYSDDDFWLAPQVEKDSTSVIFGVTLTPADTFGYRVGNQAMPEGALLCYNRLREKSWNAGNYLLVVSETASEYNSKENDIRTYIKGYVATKEREFLVAEEYVDEYNTLQISEGDVVIYGFNNRGEINELKLIYDASQGGEPFNQIGSGWATEHAYDNTNGIEFECEVYYAANSVDRCLKMYKNTNSYYPGICDYIARQVNVTIVDLGAKKGNMVSVCPMSDVRCANQFGAGGASLILMRYSWNSPKEIVAISF